MSVKRKVTTPGDAGIGYQWHRGTKRSVSQASAAEHRPRSANIRAALNARSHQSDKDAAEARDACSRRLPFGMLGRPQASYACRSVPYLTQPYVSAMASSFGSST